MSRSNVKNLNELYKLAKTFRDIDRKLDSPWCDSAWRCKEGYAELVKAKKELLSFLDSMEDISTDENTLCTRPPCETGGGLDEIPKVRKPRRRRTT